MGKIMNTAVDVLAGKALWAVEQGDLLPWLTCLPADSVDLLFCSPPYEKARLYLEDGQNLGVARNTEEWVAWMVEIAHACRRVCRGLCAFVVDGQTKNYRYTTSPFLLMADLHRAGFNMRKPPIYRRFGIPGSGGPDWLRNDWEPIVCFTQGGKLPWSDSTALGKPPVFGPGGAFSNRTKNGDRTRRDKRFMDRGERGVREEIQHYLPPILANPGNVIDCLTGGGAMGNNLAHLNEAPFPESLAEFFVLSFCPPGGVTCDPFTGSGTTGAVAIRNGRRFISCDLRLSQVSLARKRIGGETPSLFGNVPVIEAEKGTTP